MIPRVYIMVYYKTRYAYKIHRSTEVTVVMRVRWDILPYWWYIDERLERNNGILIF